MKVEVPDDAEKVEVRVYRNGVHFMTSTYRDGGAWQEHQYHVPICVEAIVAAGA